MSAPLSRHLWTASARRSPRARVSAKRSEGVVRVLFGPLSWNNPCRLLCPALPALSPGSAFWHRLTLMGRRCAPRSRRAQAMWLYVGRGRPRKQSSNVATSRSAGSIAPAASPPREGSGVGHWVGAVCMYTVTVGRPSVVWGCVFCCVVCVLIRVSRAQVQVGHYERSKKTLEAPNLQLHDESKNTTSISTP